ncbi:hypothetical protein THAOC_25412 [Thalassiosira oceanica]|uniref:Uncharacterized protein n=1 Tax=Thalassiosira oceanica TaxID=159749 RepID=K0RP88_THAOC|nr:hypothetical protein THAOC_25412 [Thalassiosira oceanica]|eukprot:EJK54915.1 hypothetical protein THAOC_25412 [Thalassiosira oceanica]
MSPPQAPLQSTDHQELGRHDIGSTLELITSARPLPAPRPRTAANDNNLATVSGRQTALRSPDSITVSGAGTPEVNGLYTRHPGHLIDGCPVYGKTSYADCEGQQDLVHQGEGERALLLREGEGGGCAAEGRVEGFIVAVRDVAHSQARLVG